MSNSEDSKKDYDSFTEAQQAEELRHQIRDLATLAAQYGRVDRGWINSSLIRLGIDPIVTSAYYQVYAPITGVLGKTIKATSRAEATELFNKAFAKAIEAGVVDGGYGARVFQLAENPAAGGVQFHSGPEDTEADPVLPVLPLADLKAGFRAMLKEGVAEHGWGYVYAQQTLEQLGLEKLPQLVCKAVQVPVSGMATVHVDVFEDSDESGIQRATAAKLTGAQTLRVKPEEMGEAQWARSGGDTMGLHLVDNDGDEDEDDDDL